MATTTVLRFIDIINKAKELESNLDDITITLKRLRNGSGRDFMEEARKDTRYSVKILVKEYDHISGQLHDLEATEVNECNHKVDESTSTATGTTIGVGTSDVTIAKTSDVSTETSGDSTVNTNIATGTGVSTGGISNGTK